MKHIRLLASIAALGVALLVVVLVNREPASTGCEANYRIDKNVQIQSQTIKVETAQTPKEREKGLSGKSCIEPDLGMLFIFDDPGKYQFWMKDMNFPIDIIWIGTDHKVVGMEVNVDPSTYPDSFVNQDKPAQYVLELQANRSKSLGLDLGSTVNF